MDTSDPNLNTSAAEATPGVLAGTPLSTPYVWQDPAPSDPAVPADVTVQTAPPSAESPRASLIRRAATLGVAGAGLAAAVVAGAKLTAPKAGA